MTEPTQAMIEEAQRAGNAAYSEAAAKGTHPSTCYDAYRAAYNTMRDEQDRHIVMVQHASGAVEVDSRFAMTAQRVEDVNPIAEASMKRYNAYRAELSDDARDGDRADDA